MRWHDRGACWSSGVLVAALAAGLPPGHDSVSVTTGGSRACLDCHDRQRTLSHPVDVIPTMAVPAHLPLAQGRITCVTCHDLDGGEPAGMLLRALPSGDLCMQCHDPAPGRVADLHATASSAHLRTDHAGPWRSPLEPDRESETCLGCHDGAVARAAPARMGTAGPFTAARLLGGQHPIGVEQRPRGPDDHLRHPGVIDPSVRLFDGRVGCGSCHSVYSRENDLLVISNERSRLCLSCHDF